MDFDICVKPFSDYCQFKNPEFGCHKNFKIVTLRCIFLLNKSKGESSLYSVYSRHVKLFRIILDRFVNLKEKLPQAFMQIG